MIYISVSKIRGLLSYYSVAFAMYVHVHYNNRAIIEIILNIQGVFKSINVLNSKNSFFIK